MIKTGIFGGSFNPIHNGHVALASRILKEAGLDEVWFLVTPQNPWKNECDLLEDDKRLELVRMALEGHPGLVASDFEFHLPKPSYTWNTLQALSAAFPDRRFTLLIGGDNWERFAHWYEHDKILAAYEIAIYPRKGSMIDRRSLPANVRLLRTRLINVSSTEIRQRIHDGLSVEGMVPPAIISLAKKWYGEFLK